MHWPANRAGNKVGYSEEDQVNTIAIDNLTTQGTRFQCEGLVYNPNRYFLV